MSTEQQLNVAGHQPEHQRQSTYTAIKDADQVKVRYHDETESPEYQRALGQRIKEGIKKAEDPEGNRGYGERIQEGLLNAGETVQSYAGLAKEKAALAKDKIALAMAPEVQTPAQAILAPQKPVTEQAKEALQSAGETVQAYAGLAKDKAILAKDKVVSAVAPETKTYGTYGEESVIPQKPVTQKVKEGLQNAGEIVQTYAEIAKDKVASAIAPSYTGLVPEGKGIGQKMKEGIQSAGQTVKDKITPNTYSSGLQSSEVQSSEILVPNDAEVVVLVMTPEHKEGFQSTSTVPSGPGIGQQLKEGLQSAKETIQEKLTPASTTQTTIEGNLTPESQKGYGQKIKEGLISAKDTIQEKLMPESQKTTGQQMKEGFYYTKERAEDHLMPESQKTTGQQIKEGLYHAKESAKEHLMPESQKTTGQQMKEGLRHTKEETEEKLTPESQKGYGQILKEQIQGGLQTAGVYAGLAKDKVASMITPESQTGIEDTSLTPEFQKGYGQQLKEGLQNAGSTAQQYATIAKEKASTIGDKALFKLTPNPQDTAISQTNTQETLPSTGIINQPVYVPVPVQSVPVVGPPSLAQQVPVAPQQIGGNIYDTSGTNIYGQDRRL